MEKILFIDPVGPETACPEILAELEENIDNREVEITYTHLENGPSDLEYRYSEALAVPGILKKIKKYEREGYDGAIIGCFYDPALYTAKEITRRMVVTAPAEASMHIASTLGEKFSILIGRRKWISRITENVNNYGMKTRLASLKPLNMEIDEFQDNPEHTLRILENKSREAVEEDGAEVIILGCTMQFGYYKKLQQLLGVPVIDPVIAALKYARFLLNLRKDNGWTVSKKYAFERPPDFND